ncbi:MAG: hypothetical protein R2731_11960 [Nocardioides sp.]
MPARLLVAALAALVLLMGGCAQDDASPGKATTIEVTFADGDVTPKGERVEVEHGQPITFQISADEAGTLHVHSTPEQEIEYDAGESTHAVTIDQPGVVEVESHDLDVVVVQLQVS